MYEGGVRTGHATQGVVFELGSSSIEMPVFPVSAPILSHPKDMCVVVGIVLTSCAYVEIRTCAHMFTTSDYI